MANTIWEDWGFKSNPFENQALKANQEGFELLAGREDELTELKHLLINSNVWIPVSGTVGVGKTSLAGVATYALYKESIEAGKYDNLLIPCVSPVSIVRGESVEEFRNRIASIMLQTLVDHKGDISKIRLYELDSLVSEIDQLNIWSTAPITGGRGGGVGGFSLSKVHAANTSSGFSAGFAERVFNLNERIFKSGGGLVFIIDNCELYEDAHALVNVLSMLRDDVFIRKGTKWIFCGAYGIVERLTDDRLTHFLSKNVVRIGQLEELKQIINMFDRRRSYFGNGTSTYLPFCNSQINEWFDLAGGNPRAILSKAVDYCLWAALPKNAQKLTADPEGMAALFDTWLKEQTSTYVDNYEPLLEKKPWKIFVKLNELGGMARPSDYKKFDCNSSENLANHIRVLKDHGLVDADDDEENLKKTIYRLTEKGRWTIYSWKAKCADSDMGQHHNSFE